MLAHQIKPGRYVEFWIAHGALRKVRIYLKNAA